MLKKIKIFLFITITALVLPGLVHAQEASNNIMPGSHVTYGARIADLENQYAKHMARIADLERVERELHAQLAAAPSAAPAMPPTAAPTACTAELTAAKARVASLERELAKAPPAPPALTSNNGPMGARNCIRTKVVRTGAISQQVCAEYEKGASPPSPSQPTAAQISAAARRHQESLINQGASQPPVPVVSPAMACQNKGFPFALTPSGECKPKTCLQPQRFGGCLKWSH